MNTETNHIKIIKKLARTTFGANGFFQKGESRTWIEDNDWFLTVAEFQKNSWSDGTYLNLASYFLWGNTDSITLDYGYKIGDFLQYENDGEKFSKELLEKIAVATEKANEFRCFRTPQFGMEKEFIGSAFSFPLEESYNKLMMCGLNNDSAAAYWCKCAVEAAQVDTRDWIASYRDELNTEIKPIAHDEEALYKYIVAKIKRRREFWRATSGMKKLNESIPL